MNEDLLRAMKAAVQRRLRPAQVASLTNRLRKLERDRDALRCLSWLLHTHPELQRTPAEILTVFRKLILAGDKWASFDLGARLEEEAPQKAKELLAQAIGSGNSAAMVHVAARMLEADAPAAVLREAEQLLQAAAADKNADAYLWLGLKRDFYDRGVRWKEAVHWYRRAARAGISHGMLHYGVCLERGLGVRRNIALARKWYRRAAELGEELARDHLRKLERRGELRLVTEQTAKARSPAPPARRR